VKRKVTVPVGRSLRTQRDHPRATIRRPVAIGSRQRIAECASVFSLERARGGQPFACAGRRDGHLIP
jgi:hypothetical protein